LQSIDSVSNFFYTLSGVMQDSFLDLLKFIWYRTILSIFIIFSSFFWFPDIYIALWLFQGASSLSNLLKN
jgi:hypothetical protein